VPMTDLMAMAVAVAVLGVLMVVDQVAHGACTAPSEDKTRRS